METSLLNYDIHEHSCIPTFMFCDIHVFPNSDFPFLQTHSLEITVPYLHSSAERCQVPLQRLTVLQEGTAAAPNLYLRKHVLATLPQVSPSLRAPPPRLNPALAALGKRALLNCLERDLGYHARKHVLPRASRSGKTCSRRLPPPRLNLSPARHT